MKKHKGKILLGTFLVTLSILLHFGHYAIFRDAHHLFIYLLADIAFVPLEVFFVSLVFERIIEVQNASQNKKKVYMLVEIFYIELGNSLLKKFSNADKAVKQCVNTLQPNMKWDQDEFKVLKKAISGMSNTIDVAKLNIIEIYKLLNLNKPMLINMISNPALTENGTFSNTLIATFHLLDELSSRDLEALSEEDLLHIKVDIERTYKGLAEDWVLYMEHLSKEYPFLYYSAIKNNPFNVE